jgi:cellulose synthase/poly-beta-1,6-N-acetylglucosamine synthase-like glycosyltransferase
MKFTVLIPLYNKARFIACTLESVLAQTCTDFEVLVVDDGSTDGGPEQVAACADPRVRLLRQANAGVAATRNRGIAEARGEWVAFLDADDWLHPHYLATLLRVAQACPQADTVATDLAFIAHDERQWPPPWPAPEGEPRIELITCLPARWMQGPTLSSSSTAVRRSVLLQMQPCFPVGETQGEDLDLWFRLSERAPIAIAHVPLAAYRVELAGSLSSQHAAHELAPFLRRLRQRALQGGMPPHWQRATLLLVAQHQLTNARVSLGAGERRQAWVWLWQARHALGHRRWWGTALLCLLPKAWSRPLQRWREQRARPGLHLSDPDGA